MNTIISLTIIELAQNAKKGDLYREEGASTWSVCDGSGSLRQMSQSDLTKRWEFQKEEGRRITPEEIVQTFLFLGYGINKKDMPELAKIAVEETHKQYKELVDAVIIHIDSTEDLQTEGSNRIYNAALKLKIIRQ